MAEPQKPSASDPGWKWLAYWYSLSPGGRNSLSKSEVSRVEQAQAEQAESGIGLSAAPPQYTGDPNQFDGFPYSSAAIAAKDKMGAGAAGGRISQAVGGSGQGYTTQVIPGTNKAVLIGPDGQPILDPLTDAPMLVPLAGSEGGSQGRVLFDEERALLAAQVQTEGAQLEKFRTDRMHQLQQEAMDWRRIGNEEKAQAAESEWRKEQTALQRESGAREEQRLGFERERLGFDAERLDLDRSKTGFDALAQSGELGLRLSQMQSEEARANKQLEQERLEFERETLRNPSDIAFSLFGNRGGTSPRALTTHADLINQGRINMAPTNTNFDPNGILSQLLGQANTLLAPRPPRISAAPGAPAPRPVAGAPAMAAAINPYDEINRIAAMQNASGTNTSGFNTGANATMGGIPLDGGLPRLAAGGFIDDPMFEVGDSLSGAPTGVEETIVNPTGAPLAVLPTGRLSMPQVPGYAQGTMDRDDNDEDNDLFGFIKNIVKMKDTWEKNHVKPAEKARKGTSKPNVPVKTPTPNMPRYALGTLPSYQPSYLSPVQKAEGYGNWQTGQPLAGRVSLGGARDPRNPYLSSSVGVGTRGSISGSGILSDWDTPTDEDRAWFQSYNAPQAPAGGGGFTAGGGGSMQQSMLSAPPVTQEELIAQSREATPTGVASVMRGERPRGFDIKGLPLLSAQGVNSLTKGEKEALNTRLAIEFQTTIDELMGGIKSRYGGTRLTPAARFAIR